MAPTQVAAAQRSSGKNENEDPAAWSIKYQNDEMRAYIDIAIAIVARTQAYCL